MLKRITYSKHALTVIDQRQLDLEWFVSTIRHPDWREPDKRDAQVQRRFKAIPAYGGRVLRVACVEDAAEIHVISAFIDRNARPLA